MHKEKPSSGASKNISGTLRKHAKRFIQGMLIGLGAVLPGISGGVLCVIFGIYVGFLGVAKLLGFLLNKYPGPSVCVFVGLIAGMLPSLFREAGEKGRSRTSYISMTAAFVIVLALLLGLNSLSVKIEPNFGWYLFCGFCLALSVIAPGMSFSTLLMPLGLYTPFVSGLGSLDFGVIIPGVIGAVVTVVCLARAVNYLFKRWYSTAFHAIIGVVVAATIVIIPFGSFAESTASCVTNLVCLAFGVAAALLFSRFNAKHSA